MQTESNPREKDKIIKPAGIPAHLSSLAELNAFKASNPEERSVGNGLVARQITEEEWLAKAKKDNESGRAIDKQSGMSGWIIKETGQHVMIKLEADTPYDLTSSGDSPAASSNTGPSAEEADPDELDYDGEFSDRDFDLFADVVGQIESNGDHTVVGGYNDHYQGKYQFGRLALKDVGIGFSKEARQAFLQDPELQETAFQSLTMQNHKTLMRLSGKYRRLSQREQLAILAMAHNAGAGGALDYLRTGKDTADGFGTAGTKYINAVRSAFQGDEA